MPTSYRTVKVDGLSIFYREAGPKESPTILLLHGLPSSSRMFAPLFARLSDRYHLVAPDYPGFGHSDWPDPKRFDYTFDRIASVIDGFAQELGLRAIRFICRTMGGRSASDWHWRTRSGWSLSSSRMRWLTTTVLGRSGRHDGRSGRIGSLTNKRCARICCHLRPRSPVMSAAI